MISKSPERNTFQRDAYVKRCEEQGEPVDPKMVEFYEGFNDEQADREADPEWQKANMEYDMRTCDWLLEKVRTDDLYAQNLYAALCNNEFQQLEAWPILKGETWSCSWRYAGGIIADMQQKGDYIDWYCSGIKGPTVSAEEFAMMGEDQQADWKMSQGFVSEGLVTDDVREDLQRLGWTVLDNDSEQV